MAKINIIEKKKIIMEVCQNYDKEIESIKIKSRKKKIIIFWFDLVSLFYMNPALGSISMIFEKSRTDEVLDVFTLKEFSSRMISGVLQESVNGISDIKYDVVNNIYTVDEEKTGLVKPLKDDQLSKMFDDYMLSRDNKLWLDNFACDILQNENKRINMASLNLDRNKVMRLKVLILNTFDDEGDTLLDLASDLLLDEIIY
jgi:hypothetical protein